MLTNKRKNITINAQSVVTTTVDDQKKELTIEAYTCTIDSENPENMSLSKYYVNDEGRAAYADHRTECRKDWSAFQQEAQALQDELFAAIEE